MNKFKFLIFVFLLLFSTITKGEGIKKNKSVALTGSIVDFTNQESLAGVEVTLLETGKKTFTDFDGNYKFDDISIGEYTIKVSLISYKESEIKVAITERMNKNGKIIFMQSQE